MGGESGQIASARILLTNCNYRSVTTDDVLGLMPAFAAAITVPNMMTAESIAAKTKPKVFICIPLTRNTHARSGGYAKKAPAALGDYAALTIRSSESARPPRPRGIP